MGDFYEKYLSFGLVLDRLAILKEKLGQIWTTFESFYFMFSGAKKGLFFLKILSLALHARDTVRSNADQGTV